MHDQDKIDGYWKGQLVESDPVLATSFALLFLAKGRAPVLVNKLRHGPGGDWDNDPDDIRNIVNDRFAQLETLAYLASRRSEHRQRSRAASGADRLLQWPQGARIHGAWPGENLREFVEQGGFIFAEACCGSREFDAGFKQLMKEIFPEEGYKLRPLSEEHPVWRAKNLLSPERFPLWGIEHGCRTVVIYSPVDLSCYWNQCERSPQNLAVIGAVKVAENVIDYATGREMPADKLTLREVHNLRAEPPKRGALRIAKLMHAGDWNIARQAIPNLMDALRTAALQLERRGHAERPVRPRSQHGVLSPDLHPRPRVAFVSQGRSRRSAQPSRPRRGHALRRRGLRQRRVRCLVPPVRDRAAADQSPGSDPARTTIYTQPRSAPIFRRCSTPRPRAAASTFLSSRGCGSTTTGRSSIRRTISAARSSDTPASSAKATPTRAP